MTAALKNAPNTLFLCFIIKHSLVAEIFKKEMRIVNYIDNKFKSFTFFFYYTLFRRAIS